MSEEEMWDERVRWSCQLPVGKGEVHQVDLPGILVQLKNNSMPRMKETKDSDAAQFNAKSIPNWWQHECPFSLLEQHISTGIRNLPIRWPALQHHPQLATAINGAQGPTNNQKNIKIMWLWQHLKISLKKPLTIMATVIVPLDLVVKHIYSRP